MIFRPMGFNFFSGGNEMKKVLILMFLILTVALVLPQALHAITQQHTISGQVATGSGQGC